jgi:putative peptidoglycan binding protein/papain like cysteine protease AvrRpt2
MELLQEGARTDQVKLLQRILNKKHVFTPSLKEDGIFGPKTRAAVTMFQGQQRIVADGRVGPDTWQRLGIRYDVTHRIQLYPQPTNMTCWAASATMIVGNMCVGPGRAAIPGGGLDPSPQNIEVFARGLGWRVYYPQTWGVAALGSLLRRGPAWAVGGGSSRAGKWLHAIVLSGFWSDGAEDASGTMIRVHDPWPPGVGSIYSRFYRGTVDGFDFISMYVLQA